MKQTFHIFLRVILFLFLVSAFVSPAPVQAAPVWQYVGSAGFSEYAAIPGAFALDNGIPYVAFADLAYDYKVSMMKFDVSSGKWVYVGSAGFSAGEAGGIASAFVNNTPYVAFADGSKGNKISVMKFNGTSWIYVGAAGFTPAEAESISLALDNGTPYVSYKDWANDFKASVMKFNGTSWMNVGAPGISEGVASEVSFAIDGGVPYVAYRDWASAGFTAFKASVKKFDALSGNWVYVGSQGFTSDDASHISLAVNNGTPYVAYTGVSEFQPTGLNVMKFDAPSGNWVYVGNPSLTTNYAYNISLVFNSGMPYVAFQDMAYGDKASVMRFNGTDWGYVGPAGFSEGMALATSLAFDHGIPHVAFQDMYNGEKISVMKFSELDQVMPVVASVSRAGTSPSSATAINFMVTFSEPVLDVDANDFALSTSGSLTGAAITNVTGSGSTYTVTVSTGTGNGLLGLRVPVGVSITDTTGNSLAGLPFTNSEAYTILKSATFTDVKTNYWAWQYVERLVNAGITAGCGNGGYCPEGNVTRAQMAIFLLKGIHGSSYVPPAVGSSTGFGDVSTSHWAGAWIKQLAADKITGGCGSGNYCPDSAVTRAQMAIFLLKAKYGSSYTPPAVGGSTGFGDVPTDHWAAKWIKQLAAEGITGGCGNGNYCPDTPVTRAQMAVFLVKTFNLP